MNSDAPCYHGYRFPPLIISHAVWLYHRFCLSFRDADARRATVAPTAGDPSLAVCGSRSVIARRGERWCQRPGVRDRGRPTTRDQEAFR